MAAPSPVKVSIEGLRELEKALAELPKATGKSVLRRVLKARAEPVKAAARAAAPELTGNLKNSIVVTTKRPKGYKTGAARAYAKAVAMGGDAKAAAKAAGPSPVEAFVVTGDIPQAFFQEFGTVNHGPQAYMRPAWDATRGAVLGNIKDDLWAEIEKSAARLARKRAKRAAKGG